MNHGVKGWGELLIKFIMIEQCIVGLHPASIRGGISGVRFYHLMEGSLVFPTHGLRRNPLLKSIGKSARFSASFPSVLTCYFGFIRKRLRRISVNVLKRLGYL